VRDAVPVTVATLRYAKIGNPIELSGSLTAVQSVIVGATSGGRIVSMNVRAGDSVDAGDVLARIDDSGSGAALTQARAGAAAAADNANAGVAGIDAATAAVAAAAAQLAAARSRESLSATTAQRMAQLYAEGAISKQQRDQAQTDGAGTRADVAQARAGVDGARKNLAAARAHARAEAENATGAEAAVAAADVQLRNATVTAPFGGLIVKTFVERGSVLAPGSPVVTLEDPRRLEVDVAVPDDIAATLQAGTPVAVRIDAAGHGPIPARIRAIIPSQNAALRSATVTIAVASRPGLLPGMFARVTLTGNTHSGWVAPLAALVTRAGQSGVFVVRDGIATFFPLPSGVVGADTVELLGIDGHAKEVAVSGLQRIDDGSHVTVSP
jgi:multidrug efflux pump subunit AcrA (membrane-fusion protein)